MFISCNQTRLQVLIFLPSKTLTIYCVFLIPGTALETRLFIASLLILAKWFSLFSIKMLSFQYLFVYQLQTKLENRYQIGRGISADTCPAVFYDAMHFSQ